jgi:hypothetical protein
MKKAWFHSVLKLLAIAAVPLLLYPVIDTVVVGWKLNDRQTPLELLHMEGWLFLGYGIGMLWYWVKQKKKKPFPKVIDKLVPYLGLVFPLVGAGLLHLNEWQGYVGCFTVFSAILYLVGVRMPYITYGRILNPILFYMTIASSFVSFIILWYMNGQLAVDGKSLTYRMTPLVVAYLVGLGIFALVRNQANIDYMMERRKHKMESLPKKIRYYNMMLVSGIFVLVLILYSFKDWIIQGVFFLLDILRSIIVAIGWGIYYLFSLLPEDKEIEKEDVTPEEFNIAGESLGDSWNLEFFFRLIVITVFIILIVLYGKRVWRAFLEKFSQLKKWLIEWLGKNTAVKVFQKGSDYYSDEVSSVREEIEQEKFQESRKLTLRQWKKECRQYVKSADTPEKLKDGYGLLVEWLLLKGVDIRISDTPKEILQKGERQLKPYAGEELTGNYEQLKYHDKSAEERQLQQMNSVLKQLAQNIK